jgi:hypothetical protein
MSEGTFVIRELRSGNDGEGEVFRWTSDRIAGQDLAGVVYNQPSAARAAPMRPWTFGGELRTTRTDYPGAKTPSEQVLGPRHTEFSLNGHWDDRYNYEGFAVKEMRRFEAMCRRGNLCEFSFQEQKFIGLITNWTFNYERAWDIGYEFQVSNHDRPDDFAISTRSPDENFDASTIDQLLTLGNEILGLDNNESPKGKLKSSVAQAMDSRLNNIGDSVAALDRTVTGQGFIDNVEPVDAFKRIGTQCRDIGARCQELVDEFSSARSDIELAVNNAMTVLDFESWSRSLRFHTRLVMGQASESGRQMDERADPSAVAIYRPQQGESLYKISRRFYGTPYAWRYIADRNNLTDFTLNGDELLIIPERNENS